MTTHIQGPNHRPNWFGLGLLLALGVGVLGCGKNKDDSGGTPVGPGSMQPPGGGPSAADVMAKLPGGEEFAAAKKIYANNNCANCHKLGEAGGRGGPPGMGGPPMPPGGVGGPGGGPPGGMPPGMGGGPDLTTVGAGAEHTKQWLADHIRDPKKHKPESKMPAYGADKISDADLGVLAAYLASRK